MSSSPELIPLITAGSRYFKKVIASFPLLAGMKAIRGNAIIALGNTRGSTADNSTVTALKLALKHIKPQIRAYSAWALGRLNTAGVNNILQKALLTEKNHGVIKEIQYALNYNKK